MSKIYEHKLLTKVVTNTFGQKILTLVSLVLSYSTLIGYARLSQSGGWERKAENKAKAQHSWGLRFAELSKIFRFIFFIFDQLRK